MKQLLIEIEPELSRQLERVAPGRSRRRSEFIRMAIRRALWELEEQATAEAYRSESDSADPLVCDPATWEPADPEAAPPRTSRSARARGKQSR